MNGVIKKYDIVIPISKKDVETLRNNLTYFLENLPSKRVIIVGNKDIESSFNNIEGVQFCDEDLLYDGMNFESIKNIISKINGEGIRRTGWYFQQFLKMAYAYVCTDDAYIVWDSDTLPINKLEFSNSKNGKYYLNLKTEYYKPFFDTLEKLFINPKIEKQISQSFITEHMVMDVSIMKNLINEIENNNGLEGNAFYEKILNAIDKDSIQLSGFSEFETYGSYAYFHYPEKYEFRNIKTMRHGKIYFGDNPSESHIVWAANSYDTISIEGFEEEWWLFSFIWKNKFVMNHLSMEKVDKIVAPAINIYHKARRIIKEILRK